MCEIASHGTLCSAINQTKTLKNVKKCARNVSIHIVRTG